MSDQIKPADSPVMIDPRSETARNLKEYPYFTAKDVKRTSEPDKWYTCEVGVFQHNADGSEQKIGSYSRNYDFMKTFWWFRRGTRHFALYSREYTATRVMELFPGQGFKDLGGEENNSHGFCPVEFYVPDCREPIFEEHAGPGGRVADWGNPLASFPPDCEFAKDPAKHKRRKAIALPDGIENAGKKWKWEEGEFENGWIRFPPDHGFVAGCVWGDDYRWKIQYLDLSKVEAGILKREERFGYIELPRMDLKDAIHIAGLSQADKRNPTVEIATATEWELLTGKRVDPLDR